MKKIIYRNKEEFKKKVFKFFSRDDIDEIINDYTDEKEVNEKMKKFDNEYLDELEELLNLQYGRIIYFYNIDEALTEIKKNYNLNIESKNNDCIFNYENKKYILPLRKITALLNNPKYVIDLADLKEV